MLQLTLYINTPWSPLKQKKDRDWISGLHYAGSFCWFSSSSYREEESIKEENKSSPNTPAHPLWHNAALQHTHALQHIQCSKIRLSSLCDVETCQGAEHTDCAFTSPSSHFCLNALVIPWMFYCILSHCLTLSSMQWSHACVQSVQMDVCHLVILIADFLHCWCSIIEWHALDNWRHVGWPILTHTHTVFDSDVSKCISSGSQIRCII